VAIRERDQSYDDDAMIRVENARLEERLGAVTRELADKRANLCVTFGRLSVHSQKL
jgi:hypothetical protein